jgi:hypothetical protein
LCSIEVEPIVKAIRCKVNFDTTTELDCKTVTDKAMTSTIVQEIEVNQIDLLHSNTTTAIVTVDITACTVISQ